MAGSDAVPGPGGLALYRELLRHRDPTAVLARLAAAYPRLARVRLGPVRAYLVHHPDLIGTLLVTLGRSTRKGRVQERIRTVLGDGLLTSEGADHARRRRLIQPALHGDRLAGYHPVMVEAARELSDRWRPGDRVDLARQMSALTLTVVARALFGRDLTDAQTAALADCLDVLLDGAGRHLLPDLLLALPTPGNLRRRRAAARLDVLVRRLLATPGDPGRDLISQLTGQLTATELRDEAVTLLLAGHETTATALSWAWWLLDRHQRVREWWYEEIDGTDPADGPDRLPRTRAVLAEAMRLYPPSWLVGRRLLHPVELDGFRLPAGALCGASQWVAHRDGRFWPEPLAFRPERWLRDGRFDETAPGVPRGAYFPFGLGARGCVGRGFAWAEGTLVLATLGRRWRPRVVPGHPVVPLPSLTLRLRYGLPVTLQPR